MFSACFRSSICNPCSGVGDKTSDTVRISFNDLQAVGDKENTPPPIVGTHAESLTQKNERTIEKLDEEQDIQFQEREAHEVHEHEQQQILEELELQQERHEVHEHEQQQILEELELQQERHEQETWHHTCEEQRMEQEQRLLEEEQKHRKEQHLMELEAPPAAERKEQEELQRQQKEEEQRRADALAEARQQADNQVKRDKLQVFLQSFGVTTVNEPKKKSGMLSSSYKYPLHAAVKANDLEAVELLLWAGANKTLRDSNKLEPKALAEKQNKKDSHKAILRMLSG